MTQPHLNVSSISQYIRGSQDPSLKLDKESCSNIPTILHRLKRSSRTATETRRVTDIVVVKRLIGAVIFSADNVEEDVT